MIIPNNKYNDAMALKNQGKYRDAISAFEKIDGYKDSNYQIRKCWIELLKSIDMSIGDYVEFGDYNGNSRWIVCDINGSEVLLLSEECIAKSKYDDEDNDWKTSDLYNWLNNDYYNAAFIDGEKNLIVEKGNGKVFLLTADEAKIYFSTDGARKSKYNGSDCDWWLRSPYFNYSSHARYVYCWGDANTYSNVDLSYLGVCPALSISF